MKNFNLRKELATKSIKRIVVKVGSSSITFPDGGIDLAKLKNVVNDLSYLASLGIEVVLVTSGAIQTGRKFLKPLSLIETKKIDYLQACSAVGQPLLMAKYVHFFAQKKVTCSQLLITHEDLKNRNRYLNTRNTLLKLLAHKIVPVLNENDTVSFEEITVGDNDQLAAMVSELIEADLLLLLTETDGLFDKDPLRDKSAKVIPFVPFNTKFDHIDLTSKTGAGRGGMQTKLLAVNKVTPLGINTIIASSQIKNPIKTALTKSSGTFFQGSLVVTKFTKKSWLMTNVRDSAVLEIDEGAKNALIRGASLLPSGVKKVSGKFKRGDIVNVKYGVNIFAIGMIEYDDFEIELIKGKKSSAIQTLLGHFYNDAIIHRDNMLLKFVNL